MGVWGRAHTSRKLVEVASSRRVLASFFSIDNDKKESRPTGGLPHADNGRPGFSSRGHGLTEDFRLLRVRQLGENRLRWIRPSLQSPACTVENMAGDQVPSLPSCG